VAKRQSFADKVTKKSQVTVCPACGNVVTFTKIVRAVKGDKGTYKMKASTVGIVKCAKKGDPNCIALRANIISDKEAQAQM
jgi:hypothetical protein